MRLAAGERLGALRLFDRTAPLVRVELGLVASLLLAVAGVVYGPHVLRGGFMSDDWGLAAVYVQRSEKGMGGLLRGFFFRADRPVLSLYLFLSHAAFGLNAHLHLAATALMATLMSAVFYVVLRLLGFERVHAFVPAVLALVFPWSDSVHLWAAACAGSLATAIALGGLTNQSVV